MSPAGCPRGHVPRERWSLRHIPATFRCIMFREQVLLHCSAHSADSRDVILSRRACDASKNLLRFPQSSCSAIVSAFPPLSFRPKRGVKRRAERRNLSHCTIVFAMYICPCSIPSPYCHPARSFDFVPRYTLGTSLRMTECTAFYAVCVKRSLPAACRRCRIPRTGIIALHGLLRGQPHCHSEPPRMRRVEESA